MGYNEEYVTDLIYKGAKAHMISDHELSLMEDCEYRNETEGINKAIAVLKNLNFGHYRNAKKHSTGGNKNKLDMYLAIDDILIDNRTPELTIGIDWTLDRSKVISKIKKHAWMKPAHEHLNLDYIAVVHISNGDLLDLATEEQAAEVHLKMLKAIVTKVTAAGFVGAIAIDIRDYI